MMNSEKYCDHERQNSTPKGVEDFLKVWFCFK